MLNILIIGGTKFIGPCIADHLLARGYFVSMFNRGNRSSSSAFESFIGDRNIGFSGLNNKKWDVVIDTCCFFPYQAQIASQYFHKRANKYVFVSTVNAYRDAMTFGIDETYPTAKASWFANRSKLSEKNYGLLKSECEKTIKKFFPNEHLILRPGYITGKNDPAKRLKTLIERINDERNLKIPGKPDDYWQVIDVEDIAEWICLAIEHRFTGTFNLTGFSIEISKLIRTLSDHFGILAEPRWLSQAEKPNLVRDPMMEWANLPTRWRYLYSISCEKALRHGLTFRPITMTAESCLPNFIR
jgi:2'-hydroxyisoflavone reductase